MSVLDVLLEKTRVGFLEREDDENYRFSFDNRWLELEMDERPVLGQFFEDRMPDDIVTACIPCWFAHLLPQGPLLRMIARDAGVEADEDFDILQYVGADLSGAVILRPGTPQPHRKKTTDESKAVVDGRLRFSALAGAQWKLSVHEGERGIVLPVQGGAGDWIAKFHNPEFKDLPRIEHATMTWAKNVGIDIPPFRLANANEFIDLPVGIPTGDGSVFLIERFDRRPQGKRIHMEDFGQVLDRPPGNGPDGQFSMRYEHIASVLAQIGRAGDVRQLCERIVFCALAGNADAHLKNWSIIYPNGRTPQLSPAYDLVSTVLYPKLDDFLALELGKSRLYEDVNTHSFELFARVTNHSHDEVVRWAIEYAQKTRAVWDEHATDFEYAANERAKITKHLDRIPLGR